MIEAMPNMKDGILRALRCKLHADISTYDVNLENLLQNSVGIGEHSNITAEAEGWVKKIGEAQEAISVIDAKLGKTNEGSGT